MIKPFYIIAAVLLLVWLLGFMVFDAGNFIHLVFLAAVYMVVVQFIKDDDKEIKKEKNKF